MKKTAVETWEYVNWLTHAKNAMRMDAEIGLKVVEHLLGMFTAARLRIGRMNRRCAECGSYELVAGTCRHCGWVDPSYEPPEVQEWSEEERARRLATPCVPSSDISTFMGPHDFPYDRRTMNLEKGGRQGGLTPAQPQVGEAGPR